MLTLFTNRYQAFRPAQGVPVRITLGAPRFKLPYTLTHAVRELAPRRAYFGTALDVYAPAYRADLDRLGAPAVAARLQDIATQAGDHRLVLLCFEDLSKPGEWCHRRMFAQWWQETTGDDVRELGPTPEFEQDTLM